MYDGRMNTAVAFKGNVYPCHRQDDTVFMPPVGLFAQHAGKAYNVNELPEGVYEFKSLIEAYEKPKRGRPRKVEENE